jgi:aspartate-semialdehyde dehydrogenase
MPAWAAEMPVSAPVPPLECDLVFSSLPADVAAEAETAFAKAGRVVVSNSSPHRMDADVPLLIPEVNAEHLCLVDGRNGGFIVTNPNCTAIGVALALAPLHARFGVTSVTLATMQALSGAGYPGVAALDVTDNVIPYIAGEEEKVERELGKLLGRAAGRRVEPASFPVSAQCHRVAVQDGHLAAMWVRLEESPPIGDVRAVLANFRGPPQDLGLHSAPVHPVLVRDEPDRPQPRLDRDAGSGMSVTVGRLARDAAGRYRMLVLSHNTIRGAAGAAVLNAELLVARDLIPVGSEE